MRERAWPNLPFRKIFVICTYQMAKLFWNAHFRVLALRSPMKVLVTQSCQAMDCSLPGSSAHGIPQVRILELDSHSLLQGIFLTQGWWILYRLGHQGRLPAQALIRWGSLLSDHGQVTSPNRDSSFLFWKTGPIISTWEKLKMDIAYRAPVILSICYI